MLSFMRVFFIVNNNILTILWYIWHTENVYPFIYSYMSSSSHRFVNIFYKGAETASAPKTDTEMALKSIPELTKLQGIPEEQLYARARVIAHLDKAITDPVSFFGKTKAFFWWQEWKEVIQNFQQVRSLLVSQSDPNKIAETKIQTYFLGFDAPGDTNLGFTRTDTELRRFLQRFMSTVPGHLQIISDIFPPAEAIEKLHSPEQIAIKTRIDLFLVSLGTIPSKYEKDVRQASDLLKLNKLDAAIIKLRPILKEWWNININDVTNKDTHAETIRSIGNTKEAAKIMAKASVTELEKWESMSPEQTMLRNLIKEKLRDVKKAKTAEATRLYEEMLKNLPATDPMKLKLASQKETMIDEIASEQAYITILDRHIKKNGETWLGNMLAWYNDMRWLYGTLNFSDENKKVATESAIMLASFVATAWLWAVLTSIAMSARALAWSNALAAVAISEKANSARQLADATVNAGKAVARGGLNIVAAGAALGAAGNEVVQANKFTKTAWEALKFTTADAVIRASTRSEWEKSSLGFEQFMTNLAKNTAMFTAFASVEKFMNVQALDRIKWGFGLKDSNKLFVLLDLPALTVGDIAVMQAMHAAETGKFELDMLGVYQGLAFRVGMKGTEWLIKQFPNISEKFRQRYGDIKDRVRTNTPEPTLIPEWSFHGADDMAHGARLEPAGPKVSRVKEAIKQSTPAEFLQKLDTLSVWSTVSFHHPGNAVHPEGIMSFQILSGNRVEIIQMPKRSWDGSGKMNYTLTAGDTVGIKTSNFSDGASITFTKDGKATRIDLSDAKGITLQPSRDKSEATWWKKPEVSPVKSPEIGDISNVLKINDKISKMKSGDTISVTTQNGTFVFQKLSDDGWYKLLSTTNAKHKEKVWKTSKAIGFMGGNRWFVAESLMGWWTTTVKAIEFSTPDAPKNYFREKKAGEPLRLWWDGKTAEGKWKTPEWKSPRDTLIENRQLLETRKAELEQYKKEKPGDVSRDADLLRVETELWKVKAALWILSPEFFQNIKGLLGKPHAEFLSSIKNTLGKWEFPYFPWKDGYIWSIRKIEPGKWVGKESVTIWELGSNKEIVITMWELKDTINGNIKKYTEWRKANAAQDAWTLVEKPKRNEVTEKFFAKLEWYNVPKDLGEFIESLKVVLKWEKYPQYPGWDGLIYTIRAVRKGPDPLVTVGVLGRKKTDNVRASELREHIDVVIVNYREGMRDSPLPRTDLVPMTVLPAVPKGEAWAGEWWKKSGDSITHDKNGRVIDRWAQARIDAEHGVGKDAKLAQDSAQVFEAATMGPPKPRDIQQRTNIEQSIAKTRADIAKMKGELRDMENSTGNYDGVAPNAEVIAKQRADIARAEKHLTSLNTSLGELFPQRQSRRETQEHLRADRQKLIDMTPEGRAAELTRVQAEGKELIGKKWELEKKLEAEKDRVPYDERRAIEKDIEEITKKIDANKRQENMVKRADAIATKLAENGIDPTAAAAALADPGERKKMADWLDKQRSNNTVKWLVILAALIALGFLLWPKWWKEDDATDPGVDPNLPSWPQLDAACGRKSNVEQSTLKDGRKSDVWAILTESRREKISNKFMKDPAWKEVTTQFEANKVLLNKSWFAAAFEEMLKDPKPSAVQRIQQWIAMKNEDVRTGQDGILGPETARSLIAFMNVCKESKIVPNQPPKRDAE